MKLSDLTYLDAGAAARDGAILLWPIGSTEAHGPHLPLGTDVVIAEETCVRAVDSIRATLGRAAVLMPPLAFTVTEYASPFSGTISIPKETAVAYIRDVIISAGAQGFAAVCLVNAHLEPAHRFAMRDAKKAAQERTPCPVVIADPCDRRWVPTMTEEFQSGSCHAGQYETSLVLAASAPVKERNALPAVDIDLVEGMKAGQKTFVDMGADRAYFGRPAEATLEEGNNTYRRLVEIVVTMLGEALE